MARATALAAAMELSAIRLYERASLLLTGEAAACVKQLLRDEYSHLRDFRRLSDENDNFLDEAEGLLTAAEGESILFPGGLTEVARKGSLSGEQSLLTAAAEAEKKSIAYYDACAADPKSNAKERELFAIVANQEREHLQILQLRLQGLS